MTNVNALLILFVTLVVFVGVDTLVFVLSGALSFKKRWRWLFSKKNR